MVLPEAVEKKTGILVVVEGNEGEAIEEACIAV